MTITKEQVKWLRWLHERNGQGFIDRYGRVVAAGEVSAQGAHTCWINLVAKGLVAGGDSLLRVTPAGVNFCCDHREPEKHG